MLEPVFERITLDEVDSTNEYAKKLRPLGKNTILLAKRQTGGRGTKGRSFSSEEGGVYLSLLRFYEDFSAKRAFEIMAGAAVAVCETLKGAGLQPVVKWPNDIHVAGKKICGVLIENVFSGDRLASSIVGIGVNVCNPLPTELLFLATSVRLCGSEASVEEVAERLIAELKKPCSMQKYREYLGYMGSEATLIISGELVPATLLSVTDEGRLRVEIGGEEKLLSAAEVSLRV